MIALDSFRLLDQLQGNLTGLRNEMRSNAAYWEASAQTTLVATIASWMNDCATAYYTRLDWVTTAQADPSWSAVMTMYGILGGTEEEITSLLANLRASVDYLAAAPKNTKAEIIAACNGIIEDVPATFSLWPE